MGSNTSRFIYFENLPIDMQKTVVTYLEIQEQCKLSNTAKKYSHMFKITNRELHCMYESVRRIFRKHEDLHWRNAAIVMENYILTRSRPWPEVHHLCYADNSMSFDPICDKDVPVLDQEEHIVAQLRIYYAVGRIYDSHYRWYVYPRLQLKTENKHKFQEKWVLWCKILVLLSENCANTRLILKYGC
jgi:hypothetical protein